MTHDELAQLEALADQVKNWSQGVTSIEPPSVLEFKRMAALAAKAVRSIRERA